MKVALADFSVTPRARELVDQALSSSRLTYGHLSMRFEEQWAKLHDCRHAIFVNSGTSALVLAIQALKISRGWRNGDEVILPATTFVATHNAVVHNNLKPVVVDVDSGSFGISPNAIRRAITKRTRCVIPVHVLGRPCNMLGVLAATSPAKGPRKISVLEDSCESVGSAEHGLEVGSMGDAGVFSTYAAHPFCTGVGGFVTTNSQELSVLVRSLANHGRDPSYLNIDDSADPRRRFKFNNIGHSFRATELEAALGLAQIEEWPQTERRRREVAYSLIRSLPPFLTRYAFMDDWRNDGFKTVPMNFPIITRNAKEKARLVKAFEAAGIQTRDIVTLIDQPCYNWTDFGCPISKMLARRAIYIGCHPGMTQEHIDYVAKIARAVCR